MATPFKTVAFHTLGCKLNYAETSSLVQDFIKSGYAHVNFQDPAYLYVINSCSVTDNADKKARKTIRQALKRSPSAKIAIVGCYAQLKQSWNGVKYFVAFPERRGMIFLNRILAV